MGPGREHLSLARRVPSEPFVFETLISPISIIQARATEQTELPPLRYEFCCLVTRPGPFRCAHDSPLLCFQVTDKLPRGGKTGKEQVKTGDSPGDTG